MKKIISLIALLAMLSLASCATTYDDEYDIACPPPHPSDIELVAE